MAQRRHILWIDSSPAGPQGAPVESARLEATRIADVAKIRDVELAGFDAVFLVARSPDEALPGLRTLRGATHALPVGVGLCDAQPGSIARLAAAGASRVFMLASDPAATRDLEKGVEALAFSGRSGSEPMRAVLSESPAMKPVHDLVGRAQSSHATVLILGETGTGKELLARAIARDGLRSGRPFIALNCAALPDTLLESELFGHQRGSFTGAHRDHPGIFARADSGTVLLDEIGETSAAFQSRLLRVLQEGEVRPLGATRSIQVDVRVVAATHKSLEREMSHGRFRQDLYYRLAVFPIVVPPLRERPEDILLLAEHFVGRFCARDGKAGCSLPHETRALLASHSWPGNVRELENAIERAVALANPGAPLEPAFFATHASEGIQFLPQTDRGGGSLRTQVDRVEALLIRRALDHHHGHKTRTARQLGITREGLYKKMKRLGVG